MTKAKIIMIAAFLVTFAAGIAAGLTIVSFTRPHHSRSGIDEILRLTPEQREKMRVIWTEVRTHGRQDGEQRQALQKERDEAIRALLSEEQKAKYEGVLQDYSRKQAELRKERENLFQEAVKKTEKILTEDQRKKYEELRKSWRDRERRGPPGLPGGPMAPGSGPRPPRMEPPGHPEGPGEPGKE